MSITPFKKPAPTVASPARAALDANARAMRDLDDQRLAKQNAFVAARKRIDRGANVTAAQAARETRLITALANEETATPGESVKAIRDEIAAAAANDRAVLEDAAVATRVAATHEAGLGPLSKRIAALQSQRLRLVWDVLREELGATAGQYLAARDAYVAAARQSFTVANAADKLAKHLATGEFSGSDNVGDIALRHPVHPAFQGDRNPIDRDFVAAVGKEGDALINMLVTVR